MLHLTLMPMVMVVSESADLSFLSDLAWSLLTPGQQELLRQPAINPSAYLRRVQEQGARSSVAGTVTVKVNFGEDGHVIVAQEYTAHRSGRRRLM